MFFLDYFEPTSNEKEGEWLSPSAILQFLKNEVGLGLLGKESASAFGRKLSHILELQKKENKRSSLYLVKRKK
jgi:hypothetical protein